eukprot:jgi/Psemu1/46199/gm1.46199_g
MSSSKRNGSTDIRYPHFLLNLLFCTVWLFVDKKRLRRSVSESFYILRHRSKASPSFTLFVSGSSGNVYTILASSKTIIYNIPTAS